MKLSRFLFVLFVTGLLLTACSKNKAPSSLALNAGALDGGPFYFLVGDGSPDNVAGITLGAFTGSGDKQTYVVTDSSHRILLLPGNLEALGTVDFDRTGPGDCFIWHMAYSNGLVGLEPEGYIDGLVGTYDLSNYITVSLVASGEGGLKDGPLATTSGTEPAQMERELLLPTEIRQ